MAQLLRLKNMLDQISSELFAELVKLLSSDEAMLNVSVVR